MTECAPVPKKTHYRLLVKTALASRLAVWILALISQQIVTEYDTSTSLILHNDVEDSPLLDSSLTLLFSPFVKWDAFYFLNIAENGYIYEHQLAFFPLLPLLMRLCANVLYPLQGLFSSRALLLVAGIFISHSAFALASISLYRLTLETFKSYKFALASSIAFILSPSGIFLSAVYTESLFALLTFAGLELWTKRCMWGAAAIWALACATRSNGFLYVGFFIWDLMVQVYRKPKAGQIVKKGILFVVYSLVTLSTIVAFQHYAWSRYCDPSSTSTISTLLSSTHLDTLFKYSPYLSPDTSHPQHLVNSEHALRPWCEWKLPLVYRFIQSHYWNVGFLKYYESKQLPNFLMALPMILLSSFGIISYIMHSPRQFFSFGLAEEKNGLIKHQKNTTTRHRQGKTRRRTTPSPEKSTPLRQVLPCTLSNEPEISSSRSSKLPDKTSNLYFSPQVVPYIYLWLFLLLNSVLIMHVQIITRFMSSLPVLYWLSAHLLLRSECTRRWLILYFVAYAASGVVLFSSFYPPA